MPQINQAQCIACGDCIARCPTGALGKQAGKAALLHPELCTYCTLCEDVCPVGAIELPFLIVKRESFKGV
jgi:NAD-dependent dihydropyrimidine dehydrogenase PreA subunit